METKKLIGLFVLVIGSVAGCATSPAGWAARGAVLSASPGTRAIVAGPTTMHAYAAFAGGEIYNTPTETGTDADCARIQGGAPAVQLPPDRVISVSVPAGQLACLRTRVGAGYELLWHALERPPARKLVASATDRAGRNDVHRQ